MATVTCPHCGKEATMPEMAIDVGGGWIKCSECGKMMFTLPDRKPTDDLIRRERWEGGWIGIKPKGDGSDG